MNIHWILIALFVCGCASQSTELTRQESDIEVYYEEPDRNYENLGPIVARNPYSNHKAAKKTILSRAVDLSADGVIIHFQGDRVGAFPAPSVYLIEASAIRYVN